MMGLRRESAAQSGAVILFAFDDPMSGLTGSSKNTRLARCGILANEKQEVKVLAAQRWAHHRVQRHEARVVQKLRLVK